MFDALAKRETNGNVIRHGDGRTCFKEGIMKFMGKSGSRHHLNGNFTSFNENLFKIQD